MKFERNLTSEIVNEDLINGFGKWREDTTTSPSGRHMNLYKILLQKSQEGEEHDY